MKNHAGGTLDEVTINAFCAARFGAKSLDGIALKFMEEAGEVAGACVKIPAGRATMADLEDELGDCLIVLSQFAAALGTTLEALRAKRFMAIVKRPKSKRDPIKKDPIKRPSKPGPFPSLAAARRGGWSIRCENAGPEDWVHYAAFISNAATGESDYLISTKADWSLKVARARALEKINSIEGERRGKAA
jgi:NTP pyrophosphatase (non-canonical NTP hydrolase)